MTCTHLLPEHHDCNQLLNNHQQEDTGAHRKKICHIQGQRRSHNKVVGTIMMKSNPILISGWPTNRRTVIPKKLSHCCEGSRPHIRLSSLGIQPRDWESLGNLTLKATGGKTDSWKAQAKSCVHHDPGKRSSDPTGDWARLTCECLSISCRGMGWQWPTTRRGALGAAVLGDVCQHKSSWRSTIAVP